MLTLLGTHAECTVLMQLPSMPCWYDDDAMLCAEWCMALAQGCHSLSSALGEGDADAVYEMLGLCMQYWTRNAKEAILAMHYRGCHLQMVGFIELWVLKIPP